MIVQPCARLPRALPLAGDYIALATIRWMPTYVTAQGRWAQAPRKLLMMRPTYQIPVAGAGAAEVRSACSSGSGTGSPSIFP
jgi:hypothetical protein